jgi:hypothetical protein
MLMASLVLAESHSSDDASIRVMHPEAVNVLREYMERFAKVSNEQANDTDFDTGTFRWNIKSLIGQHLSPAERELCLKRGVPLRGGHLRDDERPVVAAKALAIPPTVLSMPKASPAIPYHRNEHQHPASASPKFAASSHGKGKNVLAAFLPKAQADAVLVNSAASDILNLDLTSLEALDSVNGTLCACCRLPIGDIGYNGIDGKSALVHGECLAQQMLQKMREDEQKQKESDTLEKRARRAKYGIGWKVDLVPRNIGLQSRLKDMILSHGMCCLVLQKSSKTVRLAATLNPSAAINLEYLSIALQVRRKEGREPFFSLDPVDDKGSCDDFDRHRAQVKRFEPGWLAATSVGDVLFQADYYLKELSMGEHEQPVLGMRSCLDYSEEEQMTKKWTAREWFMIRNAEICLSEDDVLVPQVRMGVEAREQIHSLCGFADAPVTSQDHPMARYAESFTKNFDLIAERRSVVYHLRELAKATVVAKFLIDANIAVEESWFNLFGEVEETSALEEVPQLWNERVQSAIHIKDGEIEGAAKGICTNVHGVYGGVNIDLAQIDMSKLAPRRVVAVTMPSRPGLLTGGMLERKYPTAAIPLSAIPPRPEFSVAGSLATPSLSTAFLGSPAASISSMAAFPQGVDLNLNQFSLDSPPQVVDVECAAELQPKDASAALAKAFWACIGDGETSPFDAEHIQLLRHVFNPGLSDRRTEGDDFMPPDNSCKYIEKLQRLVKLEEETRQRRDQHFFSKAFVEDNPGALFPSSWCSRLAITQATTCRRHDCLQHRTDYMSRAEHVLKSSVPTFERIAEDGETFRIYRVGGLEVRTTQRHDSKEMVGAVLAMRQIADRPPGRVVPAHQKISKVSQYVEGSSNAGEHCNYFAVLEIENGSTIVTEYLEENVSWAENSFDLADRISLAKVVRSGTCCKGITVQDLINHRARVLQQHLLKSSTRKSQTYATSVFTVAMGGLHAVAMAASRREQRKELM